MFVRPFDIHGHAIYLLDIHDEPGERDQLRVRERLLVASVSFPLLCTSFWNQPYRKLFAADHCLLHLFAHLVHRKGVRCHEAGDHGLAEAPVGIENSIVVIVGDGIKRKADTRNIARDLLLNDDRDFWISRVEAIGAHIHDHSIIERRKKTSSDGVVKRILRDAKDRLVSACERCAFQILVRR